MKRTRRPRPPVTMPSGFTGFRFPPEVILLAVRWYLRYGLSYRDLEELLAERGIEVDHVTLYRWVQRFTPLLIEAARPCRHLAGDRWFVDETYVKVSGVWSYVYRARIPLRLFSRRPHEIDDITILIVQGDDQITNLEVIAPGLLLGDPAFTKRRDSCFALYTADESTPRWTRCYRDGKRPADGPYGVAMSASGRWMVGTHFGDVVVLDGRTGNGKRRLHFDDRVEAVTFEDKDHFLVVLDRPLYPGPDSRPGVNWIVRCRVDLDCERATPNIEIDDYATLDFVPSQR